VLRASLHPDGLAGRIVNFGEWRAHIFARLSREIDSSADPTLVALLDELKSYPVPPRARPSGTPDHGADMIAVPLILNSGEGRLSFISTTTVFGTAADVTLSEVTIESFFPSDQETRAAMLRYQAGS
jgi:hypothetical protein